MIDLRPLTDDELAAWREGLEDRLVATRATGGLPEEQARARVSSFLSKHDPAGESAVVRRVVQDGGPQGTLWAEPLDPQRVLLVELDVPPTVAAAAVSSLLDQLGEEVRELSLGLHPGDTATAAVVESFAPQLVATNMVLDLSLPVRDDDRVVLRPMTEDEFARFMDATVDSYAESLHDSGAQPTLDAALAESRRQHDELLPDGLATAGMHLWRALAGDRDVGLLWIHVDGAWSFIYDIEMEEAVRGQGLGTATLRAGARAAREAGATHLGLNVFGHNDGARRLYAREGYATTEEFYTLAATPDDAA